MVVTNAQIQADCGEVFDGANNGTTAVALIITRAENFVKIQAGTTTGFDEVIRPLADAMLVNQVMGGVDPVNKTIGALTVGPKDLQNMTKYFKMEADKAAVSKGISLDGFTILLRDSEQ